MFRRQLNASDAPPDLGRGGRVRSRGDLREYLDRERARSDRTGRPFSVLVLEPVGPDGDGDGDGDGKGRLPKGRAGPSTSTLERIAQIARERARSIDEVGWFGDAMVGVVLPETAAQGAARVAQDIVARVGDSCACAVNPRVYTYSPGAPTGVAPVEVRGRGVEHRDVRRHGGTGGGGRNGSGNESGAATSADDRETVAALAFVRPMPVWKRALDLAGAVGGLALLLPVLVAVAAAIRLSSGGPVIFRQARAGLGGKPFTIYKFRTMVDGAERHQAALRSRSDQDGPAFKLAADPRVTRLGRFLRVTSLDELPQLWNVVTGDMSLVGPRPLPVEEAAACAAWQRRRLDVTPGITCIWQVDGRSRVPFVEWMRMDLAYIRTRRFLGDVRLLARTLPAVLFRRGAS